MQKFILAISISTLIFIGTGCGPSRSTTATAPVAPPKAEPQQLPPGVSPEISGSGVGTAIEAPAAGPAAYVAYSDAAYKKALADGRPILLYFWAGWCPICRAEEPKVRSTVEAMDVPVAGFRVDYDTERALKNRFNITYQHTTVILDTRGQESSRFNGPIPEADLRTALRAAAQ